MKLLVYCKDYAPLETGFAIAFRGFCEALADHHHDVAVTVVTPTPEISSGIAAPDMQVVPVVRLAHAFVESDPHASGWLRRITFAAASLLNRLIWSRRLTKLFRAGGYDLLVFESADDLLIVGALPKTVLARVAIRFHSTGDTETARYSQGSTRKLERWLIRQRVSRHVRVILATNRYHLDFIKTFYFADDPYRLARCYFGIVPNVINDVSLPVVSGTADTLIDPARVNLVTLGRMDRQGVAQKGFEDLFYALAIAPDDVRARINLVIVGDGPRRAALTALAQSLAPDCVRFAGRLDNSDVRKLLTMAEVIVLLSRFEGLSMFAIEGMLSQCAALFTRTGGIADLVSDNGWLVEVQSIDGIAQTLGEIVQTPRAALAAMGQNSRRYAQHHFGAQTVAVIGYRHLSNAILYLANV